MIIMEATRLDRFDQIVEMGKKGQVALNEYWKDFSLFYYFEYWLMVAFLIVPIIYILFKIDKKKIFEIGFYGYSVHMIFGYVDLFGRNMGFWNYPIPVIPVLPGISLDSSFVPVTFMLVYQWTLNRKKNYYLYAILTSLVLSFGLKPVLVKLAVFRMYGNINYFHLLICYLIVIFSAKFLTDLFLWLKRKYGHYAGDVRDA